MINEEAFMPPQKRKRLKNNRKINVKRGVCNCCKSAETARYRVFKCNIYCRNCVKNKCVTCGYVFNYHNPDNFFVLDIKSLKREICYCNTYSLQ